MGSAGCRRGRTGAVEVAGLASASSSEADHDPCPVFQLARMKGNSDTH